MHKKMINTLEGLIRTLVSVHGTEGSGNVQVCCSATKHGLLSTHTHNIAPVGLAVV